MALSEYEQRKLDEIERSLHSEDPALATILDKGRSGVTAGSLPWQFSRVGCWPWSWVKSPPRANQSSSHSRRPTSPRWPGRSPPPGPCCHGWSRHSAAARVFRTATTRAGTSSRRRSTGPPSPATWCRNGCRRSRTWPRGSPTPTGRHMSVTSAAAPAGRRSRWRRPIRTSPSRASTTTSRRSSWPSATPPRRG